MGLHETDGRLRNARGLDQSGVNGSREICLSSIQLDAFCGLIFINMDPHAEPMSAVYPGIEAEVRELAPAIDGLKLSYQFGKHLNANWKVAVENYNECFHCPGVHPSFTRGVVDPKSYRIASRGYCLHHTAKAQTGEKAAYKMDSSAANAEEYGSFFLWPSSAIQIYPGGLVNCFHLFPISVDETVVYRSWYFTGDKPTSEELEIAELDRHTTFAEDLSIIDSVQRGLGSRGYQSGPLVLDPSGVATVFNENSVHAFQNLVLEALAQ